jgi:hypothetical protein
MRALAIALLCCAVQPASHAAADGCPDRDPRRRPWFGDLHVHTVYSLDASTQDTRNRPADAYRFARGERLGIQPYDADGAPLRSAQLARPLDFAAVTDHAELLGEWNICNHADLPGHDSLVCRIYRRWPRAAFFWMNFTANRAERAGFCGEDGSVCLDAARGPWRDIRDAARDANAPCEFTTFVGYEWTGAAGYGNNLHRNVIFRSDAVPELPVSFVDAQTPETLWSRLRSECLDSGNGCDVVVIPHNSNLSGGRMFRTEDDAGRPIDAEAARERSAFEPLVEVMQHKGEMECMTGLDSADELCTFENLSMHNFGGRYVPLLAEPPLPRQFVRNVLKEGLSQEARLGANPFRFGLIASTDTHLGTPGLVAEDASYPGHGGAGTPVGSDIPSGLPDAVDFNPGGLAVLWAEQNTREALFAAMRRREAYGTSGPRMVVRLFGGYGFDPSLCGAPDLASVGYARGVPMGAELPPPADRVAPGFAVSALRDPGTAAAPGAPLERIQIVKAWSDGTVAHERVFDVARAPGAASVDERTCAPSGAGADALCGVWSDPDFDPALHALYYARVLEVPTCRWSWKLCRARGVDCSEPESVRADLEACCEPELPRTIQERAWTSPIWYRPG